MLPQVYDIQCKCGSSMLIQVGSADVLVRVYCKKCKAVILEQTPQNAVDARSSMSASTPFLQKTAGILNTALDKKKSPPMQTERHAAHTKFGDYILSKQLGEGAMGKVYLAIDEKSGENVALKVLRKPEDNKALEYFIREVQVMRKLNHPNIVALKGWGNVSGYPYFAMEYIVGNSLEEILDKGPVEHLYAVQIISYLLDALDYASQFQIIHRDIKPPNILIANTGEIKLIDLGVGKILKESINLTQTGQLVGTGYYMPIEQLQDAKRADYRSDIYAVGATFYHALCGYPPYSEHGKNLNKILWAKINETYTRLAERNSQIPPELIKIVEKAMAHELEKRYSTAAEMKQALVNFTKQGTK